MLYARPFMGLRWSAVAAMRHLGHLSFLLFVTDPALSHSYVRGAASHLMDEHI